MQRHSVVLICSDECGWTDVKQILTEMPDVDLVGESHDPRKAKRLAESLSPSVIIAPTILGGTSTLALLGTLRNHITPASKIIVIARRLDVGVLSRLAAIGVEGHLLWADLSIDTLSHCLATVVRSDVFVASRDVVEAFVANQQSQVAVAISDRERTVLCWLLEGLTQAEVAQKEGMSRRTVERVVTNLEQKFETRSLFALGWKVGRLRLLDEHETSRS